LGRARRQVPTTERDPACPSRSPLPSSKGQEPARPLREKYLDADGRALWGGATNQREAARPELPPQHQREALDGAQMVIQMVTVNAVPGSGRPRDCRMCARPWGVVQEADNAAGQTCRHSSSLASLQRSLAQLDRSASSVGAGEGMCPSRMLRRLRSGTSAVALTVVAGDRPRIWAANTPRTH
jgi:hypothetical protein